MWAYLMPSRPKGRHPNEEHWLNIRSKRLEIANQRCETCNLTSEESGVNLECHHRHYKTWGEETVDDVRILCEDCHDAITAVWMKRRDLYLNRYKLHEVSGVTVERSDLSASTCVDLPEVESFNPERTSFIFEEAKLCSDIKDSQPERPDLSY